MGLVVLLVAGLSLLGLGHSFSFVDQVGNFLCTLVGKLSREQLVLDKLFGVLQHDRQNDAHQGVVRISTLLDVVQNPL